MKGDTTTTFISQTGQKVFYRNWITGNPPKAVMAIVHGLNSHSGYYEEFAKQLNQHNYVVYALDLRGHGNSEGNRYYIDNLKAVVSDIDILVNISQSENPSLPLFLFGHSAGGVFASVYALQFQGKLNGLISESFAFQVAAPRFALVTLKLLGYLLPYIKVVQLKNEDFSRDPALIKTMNTDPFLANEKQPARTMQQLVKAAEYLKNAMTKINLPLLILHGTADKVTKPTGSKYFYQYASSTDKTIKLYEGHFHDLLNDLDSNRVIDDIMTWLDQRI